MGERTPGRVRGLALAGVLAWALVCTGLYALLSWRRLARFEPASWDNAIFEQALRGYAELRGPIVDVKGPGFNLLGDHFSPLLAVLAPIYRLVPGPETVLFAQAALLGASVAVVTAAALRHAGPWAGWALGVAYGLSFGLVAAVQADFHEVALAAPLLACAGAAFVDRRPVAVVGWTLPLLLVKEDLGATVLMAGVALWLVGRRRHGAVLAAAGAVGAALVLLVLIPWFNPDGGYDYAASVGGDRGVFTVLVDAAGTKAITLVLTFAVTGFAALASPWALLVLPTFAWRFVGDTATYWGTDWHYSLVLMPIVFLAALDAMTRRPTLRLAAVPALVVTLAMVPTTALWDLTRPETYGPGQRAQAARAVLDQVPAGASVETDIGLITHLVTDRTVYWLGTSGRGTMPPGEPEYVLLDHAGGYGSPDSARVHGERRWGGTWRTVVERDGYDLARRVAP